MIWFVSQSQVPTPHPIYPPKSTFPTTIQFKINSDIPAQTPMHSSLKRYFSLKQQSQIPGILRTSDLHKGPGFAHETLTNGKFQSTPFTIEHTGSFPSIWNALIRKYVAQDSPRKALLTFRGMRRQEIVPDNFTYPFVFKGCAVIGDLREGKQVHGDVIKYGLDSNVYVQNTLILFYGSCGEIGDARQVFDEMSLRNVVSWNSMISACVDNLEYLGAVEVFVRMWVCGYEADETTMVLFLSACSELGSLNLGKWSHGHVLEKGLSINCHLGTSLVSMYAKCGSLNYARVVFDQMSERNVLTWTAMISALAQHGFAIEALNLFSNMKAENQRPNDVTFLGVICACSHGGLIEEGYQFFHEMKHFYGIKPMVAHYGAMVDMLSRAGLVNEAYSFIMSMPTQPDAVVWRTLLSAFSVHKFDDKYGIEKKVRIILMDMEPKRFGNLVLISNMYAEDGMWEDAETFRAKIEDSSLKKIAGESSIEVGKSVYKFKAGYHHCFEYEGMYSLLIVLSLHMKMVDLESDA